MGPYYAAHTFTNMLASTGFALIKFSKKNVLAAC